MKTDKDPCDGVVRQVYAVMSAELAVGMSGELCCFAQVFTEPSAMRPLQSMLKGAGRLLPTTTSRPLQLRKSVLHARRSCRRVHTAAVLQSRVEPVAVPAAAGRAVVGGGVTDPVVEVAPPTPHEARSFLAAP